MSVYDATHDFSRHRADAIALLEHRADSIALALEHNKQTLQDLTLQIERHREFEQDHTDREMRSAQKSLRRLLGQLDSYEPRLSTIRSAIHNLHESYRTTYLVQNTLDSVKLEYISQNNSRVGAFFAIAFLPGIFMSASTFRCHCCSHC